MNNIAKRRSYQELTSLRTSFSKREATSFSKKEIYRADLGSRERKSYNELRTSRDLSACRNIHSCNDMVGYKEYANNREKRSMSQSREKRQSYHELKGSYNELKGNYNELKGSYNELNRGSYNELSTCKGSQEYLRGSFQNLRNMKEKRERRSCQDVTNLVDLGSSTNLSSFMEKGSCEELAAENWKIKMFLESTEVTGYRQGQSEMANLNSNQAYLQQTLDREFLNCGICLGRYCNPKVLPCLHTFCQVCLSNYIPDESLSVSCPVCRQQSIIPVDGVKALQTNFFITNLMEIGRAHV